MYAYSFFYFFNTSDMNGLLQVCGVRIGLVWVGLGWAGLGWAGLGWAGSGRVASGRVGVFFVVRKKYTDSHRHKMNYKAL